MTDINFTFDADDANWQRSAMLRKGMGWDVIEQAITEGYRLAAEAAGKRRIQMAFAKELADDAAVERFEESHRVDSGNFPNDREMS